MAGIDNIPGIDKVFVVIRSIGERTENLCHEFVIAQGIQEKNIAIINESPFSKALKSAYETGIKADRPWTLCLDADVLLLPGSIEKLVRIADKQNESILEIRGLVLDKFFGGPRQAGNHLYRTSLLPKAIELIPNSDIRPEQSTLDQMKDLGYPWKRINLLLGLHDYEQYNQDIFRKCFVQAHKHQEYAEIFVTYWPQKKATDSDFFMALEGYRAGLGYQDHVQIDNQQRIYLEEFNVLNFPEKSAIQAGSKSIHDIEKIVKDSKQPAVYSKYFQYDLINEGDRFPKVTKLKSTLIRKRKLGLIRLPFFIIGWGLEKLGLLIKNLFDNTTNTLD